MSTLQDAIIKKYKSQFPQDKLRHISEKTSIQITRVFRILNGSEMKISEYEAFENCLHDDNSHLEIISDLKRFLNSVSEDSAKRLQNKLKHSLTVSQLRESCKVKQFSFDCTGRL